MKEIIAREMMTTPVFTVPPEMSVKSLVQFFLEHQISGAPVVDAQGKVVGIVTEGDVIVRDAAVHLPTVVALFDAVIYLEPPNKYLHEIKKIVASTVGDIMTRHVVSVGPETTLQSIATIMHEQKRHLLPVIENGCLVGIIGKADVVRAIAREE